MVNTLSVFLDTEASFASSSPTIGFYVFVTALVSFPVAFFLLKVLTKSSEKKNNLRAWEPEKKDLQAQITALKGKDKTSEMQKEFEFLADSIPQLIWTVNANGERGYFNKHWAEYTKKDLTQTRGWDWDIMHPDDVERCKVIWLECNKAGLPYEIEYRFKRIRDGVYRWHLGRATPMKNDEGIVIKWFGTCTDIHDFKSIEQEAREAKDQLQSVINNAPISLWSVNKEGFFTLSEGRALETVGFKPGEVVGISHSQVFPRPELGLKIQKALEGESFVAVNDIKDYTFETYYNPLRNEDQEIVGMVGVSVDITLRKQAERANLLKTRFLANMSHELRTPLNAVIGFAGLLDKTELDEKQRQYVQLVNEAGQLLLKLIGDVLDLSRIEEGKLVIEKESFHLKETVNSSLYPYKITAQEMGLEFSIVFDDKLPEFVLGDKLRINQVLVNLIGNALKFTKQGKIQVRIDQLELIEDNVRLKFSVADTGMGIPKEKQQHLFESYTQADTSVQKEFGGSGLGLSIVKQLVNLMGSEVHLDSPHTFFSVPMGTCFWFVLTLDVDRNKFFEEKPEKELGHFGGQVHVLVAEDNEVNQLLAKVVLRNIGCKVDFANNGKECINMLLAGNYHLVLMDVQMPLMNGLQATIAIRNEHKSAVPIVGLSANVSKEDIAQSLQAGMNDHIGKPYSEEQIYQVIKKWTGKEV